VQPLQIREDRHWVATLLQALGALVQRHGQVELGTLLQARESLLNGTCS
jgi:hypothetical protein